METAGQSMRSRWKHAVLPVLVLAVCRASKPGNTMNEGQAQENEHTEVNEISLDLTWRSAEHNREPAHARVVERGDGQFDIQLNNADKIPADGPLGSAISVERLFFNSRRADREVTNRNEGRYILIDDADGVEHSSDVQYYKNSVGQAPSARQRADHSPERHSSRPSPYTKQAANVYRQIESTASASLTHQQQDSDFGRFMAQQGLYVADSPHDHAGTSRTHDSAALGGLDPLIDPVELYDQQPEESPSAGFRPRGLQAMQATPSATRQGQTLYERRRKAHQAMLMLQRPSRESLTPVDGGTPAGSPQRDSRPGSRGYGLPSYNRLTPSASPQSSVLDSPALFTPTSHTSVYDIMRSMDTETTSAGGSNSPHDPVQDAPVRARLSVRPGGVSPPVGEYDALHPSLLASRPSSRGRSNALLAQSFQNLSRQSTNSIEIAGAQALADNGPGMAVEEQLDGADAAAQPGVSREAREMSVWAAAWDACTQSRCARRLLRYCACRSSGKLKNRVGPEPSVPYR